MKALHRSIHLLLAAGVLTGLGLPLSTIAAEPAIAKPRLFTPANTSQLPPRLSNVVRQDLSRRVGIPVGQIKLVQADRHTWSDGCLGLSRPNELCSFAMVQGWRVVLASGNQRWTYRTDEGRNYRMEPQSTAQAPVSEELQTPLPQNAVFRSIVSGGFTGRTVQTVLMSDGRLIRTRVSPSGAATPMDVRQISPLQVRAFQAQLARLQLEQFDRRDYAADRGSADYQTVTLSGRAGTVRYADSVADQLPPSLQALVQAWNTLVTEKTARSTPAAK